MRSLPCLQKCRPAILESQPSHEKERPTGVTVTPQVRGKASGRASREVALQSGIAAGRILMLSRACAGTSGRGTRELT
eukprot:2776519-Lingulodinium_polyedra.AAC.1